MIRIARDLTPPEASCFPLPGCPAILQLESGEFAIIGKPIDKADLPLELQAKVGDGEVFSVLPSTFAAAFKK